MFQSLSKKIGFTETEIKVILFLILFLVIGFGYRFIFQEQSESSPGIFDYSSQDSLFSLYSGLNQNHSENEDSAESLADIKQEVLGFSEGSTRGTTKKTLPEEKSINLNTAGIDELTKLPGIGTKTAEKIIELRTSMGGFNKLEDLMDVRGIGKVKFNNIEKFLYIK